MRIVKLVGIGTLSLVTLLFSVSAFASTERDPALDPIMIVKVSDPIDQLVMNYVARSLQTDNVHAYILEINSPGVSSGDLGSFYQSVLDANAPVIAWIGPSNAVAFGGAAYLANHADVRSAAPGAVVGLLSPAELRSGGESPSVQPGDDPALFMATATALADATVTASIDEPIVPGFIDRVDPALGQLIVALDGATVTRGEQSFVLDTAATVEIDGQMVTSAKRPIIFVDMGLLDRFLRLGASPGAAFLFFVVALAFAIFEFYAAGSGLMAAVAGVSMIIAGYGWATLPIRWPAVGMVVVGFGLLVWGFLQNRIGWRAVVGGALVLVGGLTYTATRPAYPPAIWLVILATCATGLFVWYALTTVVRGRFATPTVGREELIGRRCITINELAPMGVVLVDGARWRATADRGVVIAAGAPVEIVGIVGLLLEVDPIGEAVPPNRNQAS